MEIPHEVTLSQYSGTHFEIGEKLGQRARENNPNYIDDSLATLKDTSLYDLLGMNFNLTPRYINQVFPVVEGILARIHPGYLEEIAGFAKGLGDDYKRVLVFLNNFGQETGCSQFFANGYVARNYDDDPKSVENEFLITKPTGSLMSIGASTAYVERLDGMNEAGLAVSLTFAAGHPARDYGIGACIFEKVVLDKATSVEEALEIFYQEPFVTPHNVLLADATGQAVIIEGSRRDFRVRKVENEVLYCANSYLHPEMKAHQRLKNPTTKWREQQMSSSLPGNLDNPQAILDFLTADFPIGLFEPYFSDGLGTLWSVVYEPATRNVHIATGEKNFDRRQVSFSLTDQTTYPQLPLSLSVKLHDVKLDSRLPQYKTT